MGRATKPKGRQGTPDIREVADYAKVGIGSVSRVLSGHPDVSEAMRKRVMKAVEELGYRPNLVAQGLRRGTTSTIGYVVSDISNYLFSEIALGAEHVLMGAGHAMLILSSISSAGGDSAQIEVLAQRGVDGLILSLQDESDAEILAALERLGRPVVLVDRELPGFEGAAAVLADHASGIELAVRHLMDLGHERIALISGTPSIRPTRERERALFAMREEGSQFESYTGAYSNEHGARVASDLLSRDPRPTAIIAGGNQILAGVLAAIRDRGLRVPDDLSMITCDKLALAEFLDPPLATITRDTDEMGRSAGRLVLAALKGQPASEVTVPVTFEPGRSCAPARSN